MKKKLFILLLLSIFFLGVSKAQNKLERYCKISFAFHIKKGLTTTKIKIDYGILNDSAMVNKLENVKTFDNDIQAINYMSSIGWQVLVILPITSYSPDDYGCLFKQDFKN